MSYAIVGAGGFLGMGKHDVAVPVGQFKEDKGRIVLAGATKDALKAMPKFEYAESPLRAGTALRGEPSRAALLARAEDPASRRC